MDNKTAKDLYPDDDGYGPYFCDYNPIVESFGTVALKVDDDDYQGDSRVLYRNNDGRVGLLIFGWGSCSGCDALQACDTYSDVDDLIVTMRDNVKWFDDADSALAYFKEKDWSLEYCWHEEAGREFVRKSISLMELWV